MAIPRGRVKGVSFDYGHVLGALDVEELARRIGAPATGVAAIRAAMSDAARAHERAIAGGQGHEGGWRAFVGTLVRASGAPFSVDETVEELWRRQPANNLWRHVPDEARELVEDLSAAGVPLAITTNSEGRAKELMEEIGLAPFLRGVIDSGVVGISKPDRRIFEYAAALLGFSTSEIAHVGDSEEADVAGAKAAGAFAIRFDGLFPSSTTRPTIADARAGDYRELRAILSAALDRAL